MKYILHQHPVYIHKYTEPKQSFKVDHYSPLLCAMHSDVFHFIPFHKKKKLSLNKYLWNTYYVLDTLRLWGYVSG